MYTQSGGFSVTQTTSETVDAASQPFLYWSLALTVAFTVFVYLFEGSLDGRQKKAYQKTEFPKELEQTVGKMDKQGYQQQSSLGAK